MRSAVALVLACALSAAVAFGLWAPTDAVAACTGGNPGVGCALPEHEEAKAPMDVNQIAGKDAVLRVLDADAESRVPERRSLLTPYRDE